MNQELLLILFQIVILVLALSVQRSAQAYVAWRLGDPTAFMLGRVSLNPMVHLDLFGSVLFPLVSLYFGGLLLGWAKPCPVTTRNFKNIRRDEMLTALAGPASNLAFAVLALLLLIVFKHVVAGGIPAVVTAIALARHTPGVETDNLPALFPVAMLLYYAILINLLLFVFDLIPIPPLDGSRIARQFMSFKTEQIYNQMGGYGMFFVFLIAGRFIFGTFYYPLLNVFNRLLFSL